MNKRQVIIIAAISLLLSLSLFVHDYLFDPVSKPYSISQHVADLIFACVFYGGIFFGIGCGLLFVVKSFSRGVKATGR